MDVWDIKTFDSDLMARLDREAELVRSFFQAEREIVLSYDLADRAICALRPINSHAQDFLQLKEEIGREMESRTIRAWHYSRLTDAEVAEMQRAGIHLSTPQSLHTRLAALVSAGVLTAERAEALYTTSLFHGDRLDVRSNKFSMCAHPIAVGDSGVRELQAYWGGEVVSWQVSDPDALAQLRAIGKPRVVELAVPLALTRRSYVAGGAVLAAFGRSLGCLPGNRSFDLYVIAPLPADAVLAVHSEGEEGFNAMGKSYPDGFVDVAPEFR